MREVYGLAQNDEREQVKWRWRETACYSFPPRWRLVLERPELHGEDLRLLLGMLTYVCWGNRCDASLGMVGKRARLAPRQLTRSLKRLEAARLVAVDRSDTRGLVITVSPYLVWQGRPPGVYALRKVWAEMCAGTLPAAAAVVLPGEETPMPRAPAAQGDLASHPRGDAETGAEPSLLSLLEEVVGSLRQ